MAKFIIMDTTRDHRAIVNVDQVLKVLQTSDKICVIYLPDGQTVAVPGTLDGVLAELTRAVKGD